MLVISRNNNHPPHSPCKAALSELVFDGKDMILGAIQSAIDSFTFLLKKTPGYKSVTLLIREGELS